MAAKRIGILTSGGDCPGLNAVIRGAVKSCHQLGYDCVGFLKGYEGLYDPVQYVHLTPKSTRGILNQGGTILGSTNKGRFAATVGVSDRKELAPELIEGVKETIEQLGIDGLICVGGDGSLAVAQQLHENGVPVVGVPKTIDNDLSATAFTFGFDSAIECATDALDRLHTTAASHERIMVLEVMGRHAGWIALHSGIAGGGDVILIPEIDWDYESVCHKILHREAQGKKFTLVVVAEGAHLPDCGMVGEQRTGQQMKLGGVGRAVAEEIERRLHRETRLSVLGHLQRGGKPTTFDRVLATEFGAHAVRLVKEHRFGEMICSRPPEMTSVPIIEAVNVLRRVDPHGPAVQAARALGISFGDRPADEIGQDVFDKVEMSKPRSEATAAPTPPTPEPVAQPEAESEVALEAEATAVAPPAGQPTAEEPTIDVVDEIAATTVELSLEVGAAVEIDDEPETPPEATDVDATQPEAEGSQSEPAAPEEPVAAIEEPATEQAVADEPAVEEPADEATAIEDATTEAGETPVEESAVAPVDEAVEEIATEPEAEVEAPATEPTPPAALEIDEDAQEAAAEQSANDPTAEAAPAVEATPPTDPAPALTEASKEEIADRIRERLATAAKAVSPAEEPKADEPAEAEKSSSDAVAEARAALEAALSSS